MRVYGQNWLRCSVAEKLKAAARFGEFDGRMDLTGASYLGDCTAFHAPSGSLLIFTRDTGHHTSGWFKNPEYERFLHLSISFREPFFRTKPASFDHRLAKEWIDLFFAEHTRLIWEESPKTPEGQRLEVRHYRVVCCQHWQPFLPKGEVYSTDLTERGWKSWSEQHPGSERKEPSILYAG